MASRSRVRGARAPYEVGYRRPPVASRFKKGFSGNPGGRPKSRAPAPDPGPTLDHLVQDAVLKVMGERVTFEVSPGRGQSMSRAEAIVRELSNRAAYDHRAAKLLLEVFGHARYRQGELRQKEARAEEARRQREQDEEYRRELARELAEHEELERRRQKNLRRRERDAEKRAAQAAAEAAKLPLEAVEAVEAYVAGQEEPPLSLLENELGAECPSEDAGDVPEPVEDARLYGEEYKKSLAAARKPKARPVTPAVAADLGEGVPVPAAISVAPRPVRHSVSLARSNGPLIANGQPLTGHTFGFSGTSKPPPRRNN